MKRENMIGRLGTRKDVEKASKDAIAAGANVVTNVEAGTVVAKHHGDTVFRAIVKPGGAWIVMYNAEYYDFDRGAEEAAHAAMEAVS